MPMPDFDGDPRDKSQLLKHKRVSKIMKNLMISYEEATTIDNMAVEKGIEGKIEVESDDEELYIDKQASEVIRQVRPQLERVDRNARVFIPATIDQEKAVIDQVAILQRGQKGHDLSKRGKIFSLNSIHSIPGKYMQGQLGDHDLNVMIKERLKTWLESKMQLG